MTARKPKAGAVLQFEIDTKRFIDVAKGNFHGQYDDTPWKRIFNMAKTAACDTIQNGGTFVLVCGDGKITMVQRPDAVNLDDGEWWARNLTSAVGPNMLPLGNDLRHFADLLCVLLRAKLDIASREKGDADG